MGRRKLRFYTFKNYERKKRARKKESGLSVSSPLALLSLHHECVVSLPLSVYTLSNVSDGAALHVRLRKLQSIPTGWNILSPSPEVPLVLFKLQCLPPIHTPQIIFTIQVIQYKHTYLYVNIHNQLYVNIHTQLYVNVIYTCIATYRYIKKCLQDTLHISPTSFASQYYSNCNYTVYIYKLKSTQTRL